MLISFFKSSAPPTELSCLMKTNGGYCVAAKWSDKPFRPWPDPASRLPIFYLQSAHPSKLSNVPGNNRRPEPQGLRRNQRIHWPNSNAACFKVVANRRIVGAVVPSKWLNRECLGQFGEL